MSAPFSRRVPQIVERATANLPQTTATDYFTITGGKVRIIGIYGEVTTVIQTQTNNAKLQFASTSPGATTDLCAVLDITADAVGTLYSITGTLATALKATTNNMVVPADDLAAPGLILGPGTIKLSCSASNTGATKWTLIYVPIDSAGVVVAA